MVVARCRRWLWRRWLGGRRCKGTVVKIVVRVVTVLASDLVADGDDDVAVVGSDRLLGMVAIYIRGGGDGNDDIDGG
nr:hypothetical protein [Tanacetum cinerariifolium]